MAKIISFIIALFGAYWSYEGWFHYHFWIHNGPGGGFLPVVIGLLTVMLCIYVIFTEKGSSFILEKKYFIPVAGTILVVLAIHFIGMMLALGLFLLIWLIAEKVSVLKSIVIGIVTTAVIYFVFNDFLHVQFPTGLFGI